MGGTSLKRLRVVKTLIAVVVIILSLFGLFNIINSKIIIPIILLLLGIMNILDGYCSYTNNKKRESYFLFASGIFIIFVSAIIMFSWYCNLLIFHK